MMTTYSADKQLNNLFFLRNNYRFLVWLSLVLLIAAIAMLALIFYQKISQPATHYFASTTDGRLVEIKPSQP